MKGLCKGRTGGPKAKRLYHSICCTLTHNDPSSQGGSPYESETHRETGKKTQTIRAQMSSKEKRNRNYIHDENQSILYIEKQRHRHDQGKRA